ncbi:hypothetical protein BgiBS90_007921, partial [Biomphalaria glabrata]
MSFDQNISLFRRIASYRSLPMISEDFYCILLAECGYIYTGHELDIECEACKAKTRISESWRETEKYLRHERGCEFQSSTFPDDAEQAQFQRIKKINSSSSSKQSDEHVDFPHMFISEHLEILKETVNSSGPDCDKNPGHFAYFKINSLQLEQIPSKVRCQEMVRLLKKMWELTVRISVQPLNGYGKNDNRQINVRMGTGFIIEYKSHVTKPKDKNKYKVESCLHKFRTKNNKSVYHVYIHTSRHLVLNDEEAEKTEVEFFSDSADRRDIVILKGSHLMYSTTPGDNQCLLICECLDIGFIEKLDKLQNGFQEAVNSLPLKAKKGMLNKLFIVHHPHGGDKVLSYGDYFKVKYKFCPGGFSNQPTLTKLSAQEQ